jgi:hypothetical protein
MFFAPAMQKAPRKKQKTLELKLQLSFAKFLIRFFLFSLPGTFKIPVLTLHRYTPAFSIGCAIFQIDAGILSDTTFSFSFAVETVD